MLYYSGANIVTIFYGSCVLFGPSSRPWVAYMVGLGLTENLPTTEHGPCRWVKGECRVSVRD